jgi:hypothetical protein
LKGEEEAKNFWLSGCREVKFAKVFWFFFQKRTCLLLRRATPTETRYNPYPSLSAWPELAIEFCSDSETMMPLASVSWSLRASFWLSSSDLSACSL